MFPKIIRMNVTYLLCFQPENIDYDGEGQEFGSLINFATGHRVWMAENYLTAFHSGNCLLSWELGIDFLQNR